MSTETVAGTNTARKQGPLTRGRVLEAALALVDAEGLQALSMRRLGGRLGVEAMSVYKHVANKDALLDGLVEQLWVEVLHAVPEQADWETQLRSFAHALRATMLRHPRAAALLVSRCVLTTELLQVYATLLDSLRGAGFDDATATRAVRALCSYAAGHASTELSCFGAWRADTPEPSTVWRASSSGTPSTDVLLWLGRMLPARTPEHLVNAAIRVIDCDPDGDFDAGLELAIEGLRQRVNPGD